MSDQDNTRRGPPAGGSGGGPAKPTDETVRQPIGGTPAQRSTLVGVPISRMKDPRSGSGPQREVRPPPVSASGTLPVVPVGAAAETVIAKGSPRPVAQGTSPSGQHRSAWDTFDSNVPAGPQPGGAAPQVGTRINQYEIIKLIGE